MNYKWIATQDYKTAEQLKIVLQKSSNEKKERFNFDNIFVDIVVRWIIFRNSKPLAECKNYFNAPNYDISYKFF